MTTNIKVCLVCGSSYDYGSCPTCRVKSGSDWKPYQYDVPKLKPIDWGTISETNLIKPINWKKKF